MSGTMQLATLLRETLDIDRDGAYENERAPPSGGSGCSYVRWGCRYSKSVCETIVLYPNLADINKYVSTEYSISSGWVSETAGEQYEVTGRLN